MKRYPAQERNSWLSSLPYPSLLYKTSPPLEWWLRNFHCTYVSILGHTCSHWTRVARPPDRPSRHAWSITLNPLRAWSECALFRISLSTAMLSFRARGVLFPIILIVVAFFGLFFLPLCLLLYLLPFCGELARTANDLLISSWLKLVPVSLQPHHAPA